VNLVPAMELAAELGVRLVVFCSGATDAEEARWLAKVFPGADLSFVDVRGYEPPAVFKFRTNACRAGVDRLGDLSRKRNLALLLAHLCSWRTIMLLDDDIRDLSPRTVQRATRTLRRGGLTGMIAKDFPDNSVVCHARRAAGMDQGVFISGSALVIDTTSVDSYFPEIYSEDWLFMHDRIMRGRASSTGTVRQLTYQPYKDPARAVGEEFGDTLAEGLVSLQHAAGELRIDSTEARWSLATDTDWWSAVLSQRRAMLNKLIEALPDGDPKTAVEAAQQRHGEFHVVDFVHFVDQWRQDVDELPGRLADAPRGQTLPEALEYLNLGTAGIVQVACSGVPSSTQPSAGAGSGGHQRRSLAPAAYYTPHSEHPDEEFFGDNLVDPV
jgi:hypothetical protein